MEEIWKKIPGVPGFYEVSNLGRARSLDHDTPTKKGARHFTGKILKQKENHQGYLVFGIGHSRTMYVHRAVAMAFIPNPQNYPEVNHKDENKHNNSVSNLEWCSRLYNVHYGTAMKRTATTLSLPVIQFTLDNKIVSAFPSTKDAEKATGIKREAIRRAATMYQYHYKESNRTLRYNTAGGYKWRYVKDVITKEGLDGKYEEEKQS